MKKRTSTRYPPSTGYKLPAERKFYIWRDRTIRYTKDGWGDAPWRWLCTMCDPPAYGFRAKRGAFRSILTTTMPRHFKHRQSHHSITRIRITGEGK